MAEDAGGNGRKDEVGRSGFNPATGADPDDAEASTPGQLNRGRHREGPGVEQNEELRGLDRQPLRGSEDDEPDSDALGG